MCLSCWESPPHKKTTPKRLTRLPTPGRGGADAQISLIHVRFAGPDVATMGLIELLADAEHVQGLTYPPAAEQAGSKGAPG